jgi:ribulose-phosphate 3-epimerase
MSAGVAINPPTDVSRVMAVLDVVDMVLIMSINPGFAGQSFMPEVLDTVRTVSAALRPDQRLAIDGGVNRDTAPSCLAAGSDVLLAATAIYGCKDYAEAITALRSAGSIVSPSQ